MAGEPLLVLQAQFAVLGTGRDDHCPGLVDGVVGGDPLDVTGELEGRDVLIADIGSETLGLLLHLGHELRPHDPVDEAGVVLDLGGVHERAPGGHGAREDHRAQLGPCRIDRGGVAGWAGTDDDDVVDHDSPDREVGVVGSQEASSRQIIEQPIKIGCSLRFAYLKVISDTVTLDSPSGAVG